MDRELTVLFYFASDNPLAPLVISEIKAVKDAAFRLLLFVVLLPVVSQAQNETVLSRQTDESARTREEREQARNVLLDAAKQLSNSDPAKAAGFLNRAASLQLRLNSSEDAIATYQAALKLLKPFPRSPIRIESLNGLAQVYFQLGKCDQAARNVKQALGLSDKLQSVAGRAEALLTLSDCQNQRDQVLALTTVKESLRLFASIGDKRGMARAYMLQGDFQIVQSDLVEAAKSNEAALVIWRELGLPDEQASTLINLGFVQYRKGAWQECMTFLTEAQALIDENSEPARMGQIYAGIAEAFMESGVADAGLKNAREALISYQRAEDPVGIAAAMWDVGKAHYLLGEYDEAVKWLGDARKQAEAVKTPRIVAFCNDFLGRTYLSQGNSNRALEFLQLALESYVQLQNLREVARTKVLIGRVYEEQGKGNEARRLLLDASSTLTKISDHVNEAVALFALGHLELKADNLDRAEEYLRRSIDVTEEIRGATTSGVTASLWKVDDEATAELMSHFYAGMFQRGLTPAAALREAQLALWKQKRWRSPYYWAAFVIQGRYNQVETPAPRWTFWSAQTIAFSSIMGVLLLTALVFVIRRRKANENKVDPDSRTL